MATRKGTRLADGAAPVTKTPPTSELAPLMITLAVLDREVSRRIDGIRTLGDPMPADQNAFRGAVLDSLIDQMLIEQAAAIQGVKVSDADLDNEMNANISIAGSKEKWQAQLAADRLTEAEYRALQPRQAMTDEAERPGQQ